MMTKEGSTKIVNFMTPRAGVIVQGCDHISHNSEYTLSSTLLINIALIAIVLRFVILLFPAIVCFYLFYDRAVDMQI